MKTNEFSSQLNIHIKTTKRACLRRESAYQEMPSQRLSNPTVSTQCRMFSFTRGEKHWRIDADRQTSDNSKQLQEDEWWKRINRPLSKMCLSVTKMRAWQVQIQKPCQLKKMLSDRQGKLEFRARKPNYNRLKKERVENFLNHARVGNVPTVHADGDD